MPPDAPNAGQIALLCVAILAFAASEVLSLLRFRQGWSTERIRIGAKACAYVGVTLGIVVIVWHSLARGSWLPLEDNFDALIWLALLLAVFVLYVQRRRPIGGLDTFLIPVVILLLIGAATFGSAKPHAYVESTWSWVHRVTAYGGAVAFAVAGALGAMYLVANRRLRSKHALEGPGFASLERLEHLTFEAVSLGFALLTIGAITGVSEMTRGQRTSLAKIVLAAAMWVVYAIVLHAPINPRFRGRKAAVLSVVGFVLMIGVMLAVLVMPAQR
jgi:ABC-type uncharacterized transport system permease subunit